MPIVVWASAEPTGKTANTSPASTNTRRSARTPTPSQSYLRPSEPAFITSTTVAGAPVAGTTWQPYTAQTTLGQRPTSPLLNTLMHRAKGLLRCDCLAKDQRSLDLSPGHWYRGDPCHGPRAARADDARQRRPRSVVKLRERVRRSRTGHHCCSSVKHQSGVSAGVRSNRGGARRPPQHR